MDGDLVPAEVEVDPSLGAPPDLGAEQARVEALRLTEVVDGKRQVEGARPAVRGSQSRAAVIMRVVQR